MLYGFRWQLVLFVLALLVFVFAALFRFSRPLVPPAPAESTPAATLTPTQADLPTPAESDLDIAVSQSSNVVFREGVVGSVQRLNPLFSHLNPPDRDIASLIFEGLFAFNEYGETVPRLASQLVISGDGLEYVVRLRNDIRWQNGMPFTADDVIYTISLIADPYYASISPLGAFWQSVETQKLSQDLVRFRLAQPFSSFPNLLTIGLLPEHALNGTSIEQLARHPFNLSPIGTGAYQLSALETAAGAEISALRLVLSPTYRQRQEAQTGYLVSQLQFQFYESAESALDAYIADKIDAISVIDPASVSAVMPPSKLYRQVDSALNILIFNWSSEPFQERRMRQALALSLDVPRLVQTHFGTAATYADSPYVPGSSVYKPDSFWNTFDPAQAQTLMGQSTDNTTEGDDSDSSESDSSTDIVPPFTLIVENTTELQGLAHDIIAQWQSLGLEFVIEPLDATDLTDRLESGRFDAAIVTQRIGANPDLFRYWHPAQSANGNYGGASDNEIAELLETARGEIYPTRRAALYQQLQEVFAEQAIAIPIYYPVYTYVVRDSFEGIRLGYLASRSDRFRSIQNWRPLTAPS